MKKRKVLTIDVLARTALSAVAVLSLACGSVPEDPEASENGSKLSALDRDLAVGSNGDEVLALHEYLSHLGYLPNEALLAVDPEFRPGVTENPLDPSVFDEQTQAAVRRYQLNSGLPATGLVDAETRAALKTPRCGNPDNQDAEINLRFSPTWGTRWPSSNVRWRLVNAAPGLDGPTTRNAVINAFAQWSATTEINFIEVSASVDIDITFDTVCQAGFGGCVPIPPPSSGAGGDIHLPSTTTWTSFDVQRIVTHEIGHAIGLHHSSFNGAMMQPPTNGTLSLSVDDKVGASSLYDKAWTLPDTATDIAAGALSNNTWKLGRSPISGGFQIYKWYGDSWSLASGNGAAVSIAVASNGRPWIVDSFNRIFRRTTASTFSGTWEQLPGAARDIGAGADGSVWVIGTNGVTGGFGIHKWNGSNWNESGGGAMRIAVDSMGVPWVLNSFGDIFRRTSSLVADGWWELLVRPGSVIPRDLAIHSRLQSSVDAGSRSGGYAYIATVDGVYLLNQQDLIPGSNGAPQHNAWKRLFTGNVDYVGADSLGNVWWTLSGTGTTYTTTR